MGETFLPLEEQLIRRIDSFNGLAGNLPALHPDHTKDVQFLPYTVQPRPPDGAEVDSDWLESVRVINDDLHWLLSQPHHLFWSQVIFDTSLQQFLDSYLRLAPRPMDQSLRPQQQQPSVRGPVEEVHRRVFMVFLRMSTHKESKEHFITPSVFGNILYENYLFDIPKIMDLCSIYGQENTSLLGKMISNVFTQQPQYNEDLITSLDSTFKILDQLVVRVTGGNDSSTQSLTASRLSPADVSDMILFLADMSRTLLLFVTTHPPLGGVLQGRQVMQRLAGYYDVIVPVLQNRWPHLKGVLSHDNWVHLKSRFRAAKKNLASIVHRLLTYCFVDSKSLQKYSPTNQNSSGPVIWEEFLSVVSIVITEKSFLKEFEKHFSMEEMISDMREHYGPVDDTNLTYILEALRVTEHSQPTNVPCDPARVSGSHDNTASGDAPNELVKTVKELFPTLQNSFVMELLASFHGDASAVINAILEGRVDIGRHDNSASNSSEPKKKVGSNVDQDNGFLAAIASGDSDTLISSRSNVYDYDEFDVFHRGQIDLSRINIGKKFDGGEATSLLDDKADLEQWKKRLLVEDYDEYNDDYDDTYDTHNVGADDADSADEMVFVKRLNEKGLFAAHFDVEQEGKELEGHDQHIGSHDHNNKQPPPHNNWSRDNSKRSPQETERSSSQGQDRNRSMKERHKSSRANHNRKDRAQQKMRKGMF